MCGSNSATQVCGRPVANYLEAFKAGTKPQIVFCDEIRGTILNALLDRADKAPKFAYKPNERPGFDKEITKQPEHYWPLLARCHLNHGASQVDAYNSVIQPAFRNHVKWVLRQAIDHHAFTATASGWVRTNGMTFKSDTEAGEWLHKQQRAVQDNPDGKAQMTRPKPSGGLAESHSLFLQALSSSQDSPMPSMEKLSLGDGADSPSVVARNANPMPRKPLFGADRRGTPNSQKPTSPGNTLETPKPSSWRTIYEWSNDVSAASTSPSSKREELLDTLEKLGRERQARLRQIKQISEQEAKIWKGL
ncbi:hypothetical protein N0V84_003837 [Fusarium piperis]|uniref:Uncharacterized protein n=1 Tax=Fusarium piperis TaxID=1435070 RepID=A0A9W8WGQ3_9HYPO|nr:hypothetical protein N0V84_003837 [Fusarium piperis]